MSRRARSLFPLLLVAAGPAWPVPRPLNRVAAVVNEDMILMSDVEERAAANLARSQRTLLDVSPKERQRILKEALDELIGDKLLDAEIKAANIEVPERDVEEYLNESKKQYKLDDEGFARELAREGFTLDSFRELARKQIGRRYLLQFRVMGKIKVSDEDVKAEYQKRLETADEEVRVRQIFFRVPKDATPAQDVGVKQRAEQMAKRARGGEDFAELAKKYSEGPSRDDGGDIGYFRQGVMMAEFDRAAFSLKVGEVSEPVKTQYGYHVIKVVDRRKVPPPAFEQVRQELRERLIQTQQATYIKSYVDELRRAAQVDIKVPEWRDSVEAKPTSP